jgi:hypothetical protein
VPVLLFFGAGVAAVFPEAQKILRVARALLQTSKYTTPQTAFGANFHQTYIKQND